MAFQLTKGEWFKEVSNREQGYFVFNPKYVAEAEKFDIPFGSSEFMIYQYLRWCEENGKYHVMVAGLEHIKERFGFENEQQVRYTLNGMAKKGAVVHIDFAQKFYRAKTKVWVSAEKFGKISKNSPAQSSIGNVVETTQEGVVETTRGVIETTNPAPVSTSVGNKKKDKNINTIPKSTPVAPLLNSQISSSNSTLPASPVAPDASRPETSPELSICPASATSKESSSAPVSPTSVSSTLPLSTSPVSDLQLQGVPTPVSGIPTPVNLTNVGVPTPVKPFSSAVSSSSTSVDLKAKKNAANRRVALLAERLLRETGAKAKRPGGQLISLIKSALSKGYSEIDLIIACKRGREHDWYSSQGIFAMLSEKGLAFLTNDEAWKKYEEDKAIGDALWY